MRVTRSPEALRTKAEIVAYLKDSFAHLEKAVEAIGQASAPVSPSPISPLKRGEVTRSGLVAESLTHAPVLWTACRIIRDKRDRAARELAVKAITL